MQAKVHVCELALRPRLYASSVCVARSQCSCIMWLMAMHKCYAFAFCVAFHDMCVAVDKDGVEKRLMNLRSLGFVSAKYYN